MARKSLRKVTKKSKQDKTHNEEVNSRVVREGNFGEINERNSRAARRGGDPVDNDEYEYSESEQSDHSTARHDNEGHALESSRIGHSTNVSHRQGDSAPPARHDNAGHASVRSRIGRIDYVSHGNENRAPSPARHDNVSHASRRSQIG